MSQSAYSIEFHPAAYRIRYAEPARHILMRIERTAAGSWLLQADTVAMWENARGVRYPLKGDDERETIIERVVRGIHERHQVRLEVPGHVCHTQSGTSSGSSVTSSPETEPLIDPDTGPALDEHEPAPPPIDHAARHATLLASIATALDAMRPMVDAGWGPAGSIARQLRWCRATLLGEPVERAPGPLSMGLIATREFDMYGSKPELARMINDILDAMDLLGLPSNRSCEPH